MILIKIENKTLKTVGLQQLVFKLQIAINAINKWQIEYFMKQQ